LQSSPTSDLRGPRLARALTDPYAVVIAVWTGLLTLWFNWPFPIAVLAFGLVMAVRAAAEFLLPRGARLELADQVAAQELQVRAALARVEAMVRLAPQEASDRVARLATLVREITARRDTLAGSSPQLFAVLRTATDYVPTAIEAYLRLPEGYARTRKLNDGRTALEVLLGQLDLLEKEMIDVADAVNKNDLDRLLAHGRFLDERFGRSALALPGPGA